MFIFLLEDSRVGSAIKEAAKDFAQFTCIRLKERTDEFNFINVTARKSGCWSWIGFAIKTKPQEVNERAFSSN